MERNREFRDCDTLSYEIMGWKKYLRRVGGKSQAKITYGQTSEGTSLKSGLIIVGGIKPVKIRSSEVSKGGAR